MNPKRSLSLQEKLLLRLLKRHNIGKNNPIDFGDDGPSIFQTIASYKYEFQYFFKVFKVWHEGNHIKAEILETHQHSNIVDCKNAEYDEQPNIQVFDIHDYDEGDLNEIPEIRDWQVISLLFALSKRFDELPEYTLVSIEEKESYDCSYDYDLQNTGEDPHDRFVVHILGYLYHNGEQWSLNETSGIRIPYKEFADGYAAKGNEYIEELLDSSKQYISNLGDTEAACNCLLKAFDGKCADDIKQFKNFTYKIGTTRGHFGEDNKYYNEKHKYVRHKLWYGNYLILDKGLAA